MKKKVGDIENKEFVILETYLALSISQFYIQYVLRYEFILTRKKKHIWKLSNSQKKEMTIHSILTRNKIGK